MSRTLNGETLPDDCPCVIAVVNTVVRSGGQTRTSSVQELRPVLDCPHHGHEDGAAENVEALNPRLDSA